MKGQNNAKITTIHKRNQRIIDTVMINGKYVDSSAAFKIAERLISVSVGIVALVALAIVFIF